MESDGDLPRYVVDHLHRIARQEGFVEGYDVTHKSASNLDDGFMAKLLSIKLIGFRQTELNCDPKWCELALICKIQPTSETRRKSFGSALVFQREVHMYQEVLPALVAFQEEHGVPADTAFTCFPKCYAAFHEDGSSESVIILEDLRASGFVMWDKRNPVDFESVRLLMEQIGRLHGLSIAFRHQNPTLFQQFQDLPPSFVTIFSSPGVQSMMQSTFDFAISLMDNAADVADLKRLARDIVQIYRDGMDGELLGKYGVVSHGDCWINNNMFVMENGLAKSITLLDWQMSRVTSPAIDLSYFFFSSTQKSLRDAHLDEFLQIYYTNLARIIRRTGSDPDALFPEAELQRQLRQFGILGVLKAPLMIPLILADSSEISDLDRLAEIMAGGRADAGLMANLNEDKVEEFAQQLKDVLSDARRYGWFYNEEQNID